MSLRDALARAILCATSGLLAMIGTSGALAATAAVAESAPGHRTDWVGNEGAAGGSIGDRSVSYSTWSLSGDTFIVRYLLPVGDAERVTGTAIEVLVQQRLGDYLLAHLAVHAGTQECPAIDQGYDIGRIDPLTVASGLYGFEIFFRCPGGAHTNAVLENHALFDRIHGHVDFARVQINGGPVTRQLFTPRHQRLAPGSRASAAGIGRYLDLGIGNVLGSPDRLCFLVGMLLLILTPLRPVPSGDATQRAAPWQALGLRLRTWLMATLYAITALAAGYALSLPAALAAGLAPRERLLDAGVGFLVALLAAGVATRHLARARLAGGAVAAALLCLAAVIALDHGRFPALLLAGAGVFAGCQLALADQLERQPLGRLLMPALTVPALFGFLDGFVMPAEVVPMQLPARAVLPMAVGFDLGALLTEIAVLAALATAIALAAAWPRMRRLERHPALSTDLAATLLGCAGVFWLFSRLHG